MNSMYVQTIVKQDIKIETNGFNFTVPACSVIQSIISNNINSVKENYQTLLSKLENEFNISQHIYHIVSNFDINDFENEWKIGEKKTIKIIIDLYNKLDQNDMSKYLYIFYVEKTEIGYGFNN